MSTSQNQTTQIVVCPNMTLVLKRLTDYTVCHHSGIDNIPHLCVKVRYTGGFAWFGVNVIGVKDSRPWSQATEETTKRAFLDGMSKITDLTALESDVPLLLRSLQDITTGRKRPVLFGGDSNEYVQISSDNNIQIEVYRHEVKQSSTTYGGYFLTVNNGRDVYPVMVYHRGIMLYNYITKEAVHDLVHRELTSKFPEVFPAENLTIAFSEITLITRNRNKKANA